MMFEPAVYIWNATILAVHDGDTLTCRIDRGWYTYTEVPIRLAGCNAAELGTPGGDAAALNLQQLLPVGTRVKLATLKPDKFNPRVDAYVKFAGASDEEIDLTEWLIATQWATTWNGTGPRPVPPWPRP